MNIILCGPSGAGKTTIGDYLIDNDQTFKKFLSVTNREKREGEIDGREYHFLSKEQFAKQVSEGVIQNVVNYGDKSYGYYGKAEEVVSNDNLIFVVTAARAIEIKEANKDFCLIFIVPPTKDEYLIRRGDRGSNRTSEDIEALELAHLFDYVIVNDNFDLTISNIYSVIDSFKNKTESSFETLKNIDIITSLHSELEKELEAITKTFKISYK